MYISITPQILSVNFTAFVADLEKKIGGHGTFFNQHGDAILSKDVIQEIDANTTKLKKTEPRFYTITVSPSQQELKHLQNHSGALKTYPKPLWKIMLKPLTVRLMANPSPSII